MKLNNGDPGSIPDVDTICDHSLLLAMALAPNNFLGIFQISSFHNV